MDSSDIILSSASLVLGGLITYFAAKNISHRPRLQVTLRQRASIVPQELDLSVNLLKFHIGDRQIYNLCLLNLEVQLSGSRDILLAPHDPERPDRTLINPFIQFTDFQILAVHTLNNDESAFNVPLGRSHADTRLHINVQRMKAGSVACFQVLGTLFKQRVEFTDDQAAFFPGTLPDVDASTVGLIQKDHLRTTA